MTHQLPANTRWVNVESTGTGVAIAQLSWGYNIEVTGAWPSFTLDPQLDRTSNTNQMTLSVCTSFYGGNQSNMAVMEVNMPTGFQVNKDKLANLLHYPAVHIYMHTIVISTWSLKVTHFNVNTY